MVHIPLKSGLESSVWEECSCAVVWTFFGLAFLWDWNETDLSLEWNWPFSVFGHCWVFQFCWHIGCSTFTASSFRIWNNSSTGIPSPPLALFVVMLPKAHLTAHSRMSDSGWVITPSWLSRSLRFFFLYSSSVCDFPGGWDSKASAYNVGNPGSIPGLGGYPGEGNGNPLQYFCLENPMDGGS